VLKAALAGTSKKTKKRNCARDRGSFPGHYLQRLNFGYKGMSI